ncbi:KamA family radical SAM protein [Streptacidiphilus sp. P02-A3a]|uniref:KamA family radical SAM protein n=1 Tax=Streptacidiphilus sp. P02-A3a TaxID=2704468 RepID=UPI0015FAFC28|nr:lysine 2,3-aminomutase [Streptacidiphilus sp. P02-A3a]QMU71601.1 lysine 2,3-aminomutase [Streptacidiphilus sp. P02-A3a]
MPKFTPLNSETVQRAPQWKRLSEELREAVTVVSQVLPFRTNQYVLDELIDWDNVPDDPIFRLTFPHRTMLVDADYTALRDTIASGDEVATALRVRRLRARMNPHPAGQQTHNVPELDGEEVPGIQHKYAGTVLFFPKAGQTCHAYCTFCFRWPQFVGDDQSAFAAKDTEGLTSYLARHHEVTDVLITGGDPLIMRSCTLARYLEPLLEPGFEHIQTIRLGTKSLSYWPQRFVTDRDADDLLRLFDRVVASGKHLAVMGHYSHPAEIRPEIARTALKRVLATGAVVRMQSPVLRHVNDDPAVWRELWSTGVRLGAVPYYLFVERDTGARNYFELPLVRAYEIFREAYRSVSGLARTVRGPSMSAHPGKVLIDGTPTIRGERVFALQFLQGRDSDWVRRPFYAAYDPAATWFDQLTPAFGEKEFFFTGQAPDRPSAQTTDQEPDPLGVLS